MRSDEAKKEGNFLKGMFCNDYGMMSGSLPRAGTGIPSPRRRMEAAGRSLPQIRLLAPCSFVIGFLERLDGYALLVIRLRVISCFVNVLNFFYS